MEKILCPKHKVAMVKKRVLYGMPASGENYDDVILGGCCYSDDSPKYGYECPSGKEVYYLDPKGKLILQEDDSDMEG